MRLVVIDAADLDGGDGVVGKCAEQTDACLQLSGVVHAARVAVHRPKGHAESRAALQVAGGLHSNENVNLPREEVA